MKKFAEVSTSEIAVFQCTSDMVLDTQGRIVNVSKLKNYKQDIWRVNGSCFSLPVILEGLSLGKNVQIASNVIYSLVFRGGVCNLSELVNSEIPPICGGFREVTDWDVSLLQLQCYLDLEGLSGNKYAEKEKVIETLYNHPLLGRVSFISSLDAYTFCKLMGRIVDVRWFSYPDISHERLLRYFRYGPFRNGIIKTFDCRYKDAVNSWYNPFYHSTLEKQPPSCFSARDFLDKFYVSMYLKYGDLGKTILKTTRKFLIFVYYNWLDVCYPYNQQPFFNASDFFDDWCISEWDEWVKSHCMSSDLG